jgi:hypothetical protein
VLPVAVLVAVVVPVSGCVTAASPTMVLVATVVPARLTAPPIPEPGGVGVVETM